VSRPQTSDTDLIAAYRRGDDGALSALVQRHQARVYRLARGLLPSPEEAEDATQEALIAMFSSLHRFRGESAFTTWLYRLTVNTCLKRRPRGARARSRSLSDREYALPDNPDRAPDARAARRWLRDQLGCFLAVLPDTYRLPVLLSDALELPASQIALVLNLSLPATKQRILRGRRRLRDVIERHCADAGLAGWRELLA
jgi:RNA polymerase sigma-70 factor (ECF subfamily)